MRNTATITWSSTLVVTDCCNCGILFAVPKDFDQKNRDDSSRSWHCPNGHKQHYSDSEADKLRKRLAWEEGARQRAQAQLTHERDQRQAAERSAAAYKGRVTRLKNRAAAGVCPCCNRTFENVRRHMETKHPEYAESADA